MATTREMTVGEKIVYDLQSGDHGVVFRSTRAFKSSFDIGKSLADAIDEALSSERERAARIAEMVSRDATFADDEILRAEIAAAIRRNEEEGDQSGK